MTGAILQREQQPPPIKRPNREADGISFSANSYLPRGATGGSYGSPKISNLSEPLVDDWCPKWIIGCNVELNLGGQSVHGLQGQITGLLEHHGYHDWDGEDADPLAESTVKVACEVAELFPRIVPTDISATPHGEVDFDWVVDRETMLTVSVGPPTKHEIAYAAIFNGGRVSGQELWVGSLPRMILCCFHKLFTE